ncbi:glycosyltransferase [Marinobacter sp. ANT_B65]|uniref:glycosyltransferase n=1 Tax=Marinobacter sp. ANT_B65 TaxID=2039467 RepID=UPI000BBE2FBE|nr:glycosyltransferase [Marinobacter sp. ANT_B65]PCM42798.1 glycosyltransferase [Marinobacter sp. ANT_B65]
MTAPRRLTIALIIATPGQGWGGMEQHTADLSEELTRRGHEVHVLAHPDYQQRFPATVDFHALPVQLGRRNPWLALRLRQRLSKLSPDVLHAQGNKAAALLSGIRKCHSITVGTVHGTKSSHKSFRKLDGVIAVSEGICHALQHLNAKLIHNGIKPQKSNTETTFPVPEEPIFAVSIGRLEPVKQFENLISAWASIKPPIPLYILGDGSEAGKLKAQIHRLGAEHLIKLPGYERNPAPWLARAAVCLISSQREGFPYTLVEALMARCPVLSTPVNGAADLLPAGSLAKATDLCSLQTLLSGQLQDLGELKKSQAACFEYASQELTLDAMASQTEDFYYELLNRKPRS